MQTTSVTHKSFPSIDAADLQVGQHVIMMTTVTPVTLQVKHRYIVPGAFGHCAAIARDIAYNDPKAEVVQTVSNREWFTIDKTGKSTTYKVKRVVAKR